LLIHILGICPFLILELCINDQNYNHWQLLRSPALQN
jgi:hypothetical protein